MSNPTAAERLEAIQASILAGEPITVAQLAKARAEVDAETELADLTRRGLAERAKAAKALAKRQADAKAAVRANPPAPDTAGLGDAVDGVKTALQAVVAARTAHCERICDAKQIYAAGGLPEKHLYGGGASGDTSTPVDDLDHGFAHVHAILVDGVLYNDAAYTNALRGLAQHTLRLSGSSHIIP